ncbi:C6 finger domain-containing protein [Hirsutella rhossiliensis]|uniref:C6 finger domain-containing protein n=1 Tax=Hirsutella rhossiliensis TaxID=111463 RepID=A0A9P8N3H8_9HYPO|nr:C6 finger domain-containing protein [Hirsutella rhossiliensis]KAH0965932.1 C6 finger domain-containing protein [Hirsutella rhossiliensis]
MTSEDARAIACTSSALEFPLFCDLGLRYALLKSYTIDNVGKLLHAASDLVDPQQAAKRYEDTEVIYTFLGGHFPLSSPSLHKAVARMNYLHAPYIKSGKILNADLLYVLYLSMAEPVRFVNLYEWRCLTDMEVASHAALWKTVGSMMGINFSKELGKSEWKDGLEFMDDMTRWGVRYEDLHMHPLPEIQRLGAILVDMLLSAYPAMMRPLVYQMLHVILGDTMRHVLGLPEPGIAVSAFTYTLLLCRRLFLRYLTLPRISPVWIVSGPDPTTGKLHHNRYLKEPWYVPATAWTRWDLQAWMTRACGGMLPGDGGPRMKPDGFLFDDIGPLNRIGRGAAEMARIEEVVRGEAARKYPFAACKKL